MHFLLFFLNPVLNNEHYFLRGGSGSETAVYTYEQDALQEHTHWYYDFKTTGWNNGYMQGTTDWYTGKEETHRETGDPSGARVAGETRPKNMKVIFIMKCWHQSDN